MKRRSTIATSLPLGMALAAPLKALARRKMEDLGRGTIAIPAPRSANFAIWWDGDLLRETLDGNRISK